MRDVTIFEVIRAVPLPDETKKELLSKYESYDEATKFEIMRACWDAFDDMYAVLKASKKEEFTAQVAQGKRQLGDNFVADIEKAAWEEMEEYISGKKVEMDAIEGIRKQLQSLMATTPSK